MEMAQLPPKPPNMTPNWNTFSYHKSPSVGAFFPSAAAGGSDNSNQPCWVDEFLDFSAARRDAHRRSVSDSVAYLEGPHESSGGEFERLDDEQFMSMFSDIAPAQAAPPGSSSSTSTPSDTNSFNLEKPVVVAEPQQGRNELEEGQSVCCKTEAPTPTEPVAADPKRVKRILANRQSAQRSRVRKLRYISELERSVTTLQTEVSTLSPRVAFLDHQRAVLTMGNSHLKQRIAALEQDKIFKDAHQEALKKELERLRQVYHYQQNLNTAGTPPTAPPLIHSDQELLSYEPQ